MSSVCWSTSPGNESESDRDRLAAGVIAGRAVVLKTLDQFVIVLVFMLQLLQLFVFLTQDVFEAIDSLFKTFDF